MPIVWLFWLRTMMFEILKTIRLCFKNFCIFSKIIIMPDFVRTQVRSYVFFQFFFWIWLGFSYPWNFMTIWLKFVYFLWCHSKFHILAQIVFLAASGLEAIGLMFVCPPAIGPVLICGRKFSNMSEVQPWCFQWFCVSLIWQRQGKCLIIRFAQIKNHFVFFIKILYLNLFRKGRVWILASFLWMSLFNMKNNFHDIITISGTNMTEKEIFVTVIN